MSHYFGKSHRAEPLTYFKYWLKQLLDGFLSEQWVAIGGLGSLLLGVDTYFFL
ncbi:TPA: phage holin [Providencia alcalifaciens]